VRSLVIQIGPLDKPEQADAVKELFRDIPGLGTVTPLPSESADTRVFAVETTSSDDDLLDLFVFHVSKDVVRIRDLDAEAVLVAAPEPVAAVVAPAVSVEEEYGFFAGSPGHPGDHPVPTPAVVAAKAEKAAGQTPLEATTIRVDIKKVDQLINLVGELVITQAMLAQNSQGLEPATVCRAGRPGPQHPRPARVGDVDPYDPHVHRVQPLPSHAARFGQPVE
jgi:two-component system chemotaxis sensor kinase CheA